MTTTTQSIPAPAPELTRSQARDLLLGLDLATTVIRGLAAVRCPDDDDVWTWSAELLIDGDWVQATMPDHYPEGAEIHW